MLIRTIQTMQRTASHVTILAFLIQLCDVAGDEVTPERLRDAIRSLQEQQLDPTDLVIRSNLPLARLKLRKAELLLTPGKYRGDGVEEAAQWELGQGFEALERIRLKRIAYAGERDGFDWPYDGSRLRFKREARGPWPTYYEYGMDADNDGSPQPFLVEVPPDYDPAERWPLLVYLHGYHGNVDMIRKWDTTRSVAQGAKKLGYLVVAPHGRSETDFLSVGEADVLQALREVRLYYITFGYSRVMLYLTDNHAKENW